MVRFRRADLPSQSSVSGLQAAGWDTLTGPDTGPRRDLADHLGRDRVCFLWRKRDRDRERGGCARGSVSGPLALPAQQPQRPHCPVSGWGSRGWGSVPVQPPFTLVIARHRASARTATDFCHRGQLSPTPPSHPRADARHGVWGRGQADVRLSLSYRGALWPAPRSPAPCQS